MKLNMLGEWLSWVEESQQCESDFAPYMDDISIDSQLHQEEPEENSRPFLPVKKLCERDYIIIDMLNSASSGGSTTVSFCVTDPSMMDNPVIYISNGFTKLTGYSFDECVGRNCRFLQGPETDQKDVAKIVTAVKNEKECSVNLLNYKKDGTKFRNEFYLAQLRDPKQQLAYFIGIQAAVDEEGDDTIPSNPGIQSTFGGMKSFEL
mmetsp:Transcript_12747/g.21933  ORF Transcript_12747/g.21933 Transcript_12747/m.21933 type:complete len:206 (+) Transcript_12747:258-875(+)|eukprot:CAMPEP_0183709916 /NCGR_PEP_ID=MMETSP0737-20130205/5853_1 /TAXON_ID=385413 /ORGANISM="Thalassiosira miniscula, Strain CCMP1093" /LENGTH=205 /DNA_ID=CAMNT_0025938135 /DNA_START=218 /DNA_END=835 /DNA_ORIENTATION=+